MSRNSELNKTKIATQTKTNSTLTLSLKNKNIYTILFVTQFILTSLYRVYIL